MKKFLVLVILTMAIVFFSSNAAIADETSLNRHTGPYVEANLGYTFAWVTGDFFGNDFSEGAAVGFGWSAAGGYMFKNWIGAEAGYLHFKPEIDDDLRSGNEEANVGGFYAAAKFNIPIHERFSCRLKIGAMTLSVSDSEDEDAINSGAPFTGIGVGYALTDKIEISVQFQGPNLIILGAGVLSGGLTYHF